MSCFRSLMAWQAWLDQRTEACCPSLTAPLVTVAIVPLLPSWHRLRGQNGKLNGMGSITSKTLARAHRRAPPRCPPLAGVIMMRQAEENARALRAEAKNGSERTRFGPAPAAAHAPNNTSGPRAATFIWGIRELRNWAIIDWPESKVRFVVFAVLGGTRQLQADRMRRRSSLAPPDLAAMQAFVAPKLRSPSPGPVPSPIPPSLKEQPAAGTGGAAAPGSSRPPRRAKRPAASADEEPAPKQAARGREAEAEAENRPSSHQRIHQTVRAPSAHAGDSVQR